ncbi:MAG: tetratricopeptide repeat protein, partial [Pirellulales bacterium]
MAHAADGLRSGARDRIAWCVAAVVVLGNLIVLRPVLFPGDARLLRDAETAFLEARYTDAELLARTYLAHHPQASQAWLIAGESAVKLQANERALECFAQIPDDGSAIGMRALYGRGNRLLNQGRIREAERCLRRVIEWQPEHLGAATDLTYLLEVEGRTFEALPYLWQLVRSGRVSGDHLLMAGSTESVSLREWSFVERCRAAVPEDPLPLLGRACVALRNSDYAAARQLLGEVLQHDPQLTEGQARLGRLLLDLHDDPGFTEWLRQLPPDLTPHPDIWVNRGIWARRQGQPRAAARCFWEAVALHPNHAAANHHLSQTLNALGEKQAAEVFAQRAQRLNRVEYALRDIGEGAEMFQTVAQELEHLGRDWEAAAWYRALLGFRAPPPWAEPEFTRLAA